MTEPFSAKRHQHPSESEVLAKEEIGKLKHGNVTEFHYQMIKLLIFNLIASVDTISTGWLTHLHPCIGPNVLNLQNRKKNHE